MSELFVDAEEKQSVTSPIDTVSRQVRRKNYRSAPEFADKVFDPAVVMINSVEVIPAIFMKEYKNIESASLFEKTEWKFAPEKVFDERDVIVADFLRKEVQFDTFNPVKFVESFALESVPKSQISNLSVVGGEGAETIEGDRLISQIKTVRAISIIVFGFSAISILCDIASRQIILDVRIAIMLMMSAFTFFAMSFTK